MNWKMMEDICGPHKTEKVIWVCWRPKRHEGHHIALACERHDEDHYGISMAMLLGDDGGRHLITEDDLGEMQEAAERYIEAVLS